MSSEQRIQASTTVTSEKCTFTWTIKNYRLIKLKVGEEIESPNFGVGSDIKQFFYLRLYPGGETKETAEYISLYRIPVIYSKNKPDKLACRCTVSLVNDEKVIQKSILHYDCSTNNFIGRGFKNIDELISSENTVTIQCELEIFKDYESSIDSEICYSKEQIIDKVNLDSLFLSEEFSDVKIITPDANDIPAHKNILAAASPVFRAMFTHDMLENKNSSVKITDTTKNIVTEMLRYIYMGEIKNMNKDNTLELLEMADKYQIDNLKIKCGKILCANLSIENAIDTLVTAHKYTLKNVEDEAIKFIATRTELLLNFQKMKKINDPDVWSNLMQLVVKSPKSLS
ncbi:speckle-type POZ protein-like [Trichogramma pretiosum]|uniref:speckle-type POZ protein-like n=1 Tax=Trichogramma pretiosum TaxID=7493 RepID=UPI0006C94345|nr:speckle-type POZ protein-like [Trichogramma pretiosum]